MYVYTNVPHTVHVLFILSKISKDILRTCLRTFEAGVLKIFKNVQPQSKKLTFLCKKKKSVDKKHVQKSSLFTGAVTISCSVGEETF